MVLVTGGSLHRVGVVVVPLRGTQRAVPEDVPRDAYVLRRLERNRGRRAVAEKVRVDPDAELAPGEGDDPGIYGRPLHRHTVAVDPEHVARRRRLRPTPQQWAVSVEVALNRPHERLRHRHLDLLAGLGLGGLEPELKARTPPAQVSVDLDRRKIAHAQRPADKECEHEAVPEELRVLPFRRRGSGCLSHHRDASGVDLVGAEKAVLLDTDRDGPALEPTDDASQPGPVPIRRDPGEDAEEMLDTQMDRERSDARPKMLDPLRHDLRRNPVRDREPQAIRRGAMQPRQPVPIRRGDPDPCPWCPARAGTAVAEDVTRRKQVIPRLSVIRRPLGERQAATRGITRPYARASLAPTRRTGNFSRSRMTWSS